MVETDQRAAARPLTTHSTLTQNETPPELGLVVVVVGLTGCVVVVVPPPVIGCVVVVVVVAPTGCVVVVVPAG